MTKTNLRWDRRLRLQFIELVAYWEGSIESSRLMEQFGITRPQAIKDINLYMEMFPEALERDSSGRKYYMKAETPPFCPTESGLNNYMTLLTIGSKPEWLETIGFPSPFVRKVNALVVSKVLLALRNNLMARVKYQSLESASDEERIIKPLKLVNTGFRWHIRALREKGGQIVHRDFLLPRFTEFLGFIHTSFKHEPEDVDWNTEVTLDLEINPRIRNRERRRIIGEEFGMTDGRLQVETRAALVKYVLDCYTIDPDSDVCHYERNLLSVKNYGEIRKYLLKPMDLSDDDA